jgi:hypothetical protein
MERHFSTGGTEAQALCEVLLHFHFNGVARQTIPRIVEGEDAVLDEHVDRLSSEDFFATTTEVDCLFWIRAAYRVR